MLMTPDLVIDPVNKRYGDCQLRRRCKIPVAVNPVSFGELGATWTSKKR